MSPSSEAGRALAPPGEAGPAVAPPAPAGQALTASVLAAPSLASPALATAPSASPPRPGLGRRLSGRLHGRHRTYLLLTLVPPMLWLGTVYLGALFAFLAHSAFRLDDFTGQVVHELSLESWRQLLGEPANVDIVLRTLAMAVATSAACAVLGFPVAYYMARHARGWVKAAFYLSVMVPMWTSYLVKVYAWRQILAKEGILAWALDHLGLGWLLDAALAMPGVGGPSLAASYLGMFLVFVYMWLPFMILPIHAALERVPASLEQASQDLGAGPARTFLAVTLPLAMPGVIAGSVFTFSLTLGDYIIPGVVGAPGFFIGMMVYQQQGTAGNLPLAAAFSIVPILLIAAYLAMARRTGAFDAL